MKIELYIANLKIILSYLSFFFLAKGKVLPYIEKHNNIFYNFFSFNPISPYEKAWKILVNSFF